MSDTFCRSFVGTCEKICQKYLQEGFTGRWRGPPDGRPCPAGGAEPGRRDGPGRADEDVASRETEYAGGAPAEALSRPEFSSASGRCVPEWRRRLLQ